MQSQFQSRLDEPFGPRFVPFDLCPNGFSGLELVLLPMRVMVAIRGHHSLAKLNFDLLLLSDELK